jgi:hypothetical protein
MAKSSDQQAKRLLGFILCGIDWISFFFSLQAFIITMIACNVQ